MEQLELPLQVKETEVPDLLELYLVELLESGKVKRNINKAVENELLSYSENCSCDYCVGLRERISTRLWIAYSETINGDLFD